MSPKSPLKVPEVETCRGPSGDVPGTSRAERVETNNYILTVKEKKILLCDTEWLNDNIMDTAQKLVCKALGRLETIGLCH